MRDFLKKMGSVKNLALSGKIVVGYCWVRETIMFFFFIDGFKEKIIKFFTKIM